MVKKSRRNCLFFFPFHFLVPASNPSNCNKSSSSDGNLQEIKLCTLIRAAVSRVGNPFYLHQSSHLLVLEVSRVLAEHQLSGPRTEKARLESSRKITERKKYLKC